ncbi:PEP-CTERM sorting domain-containing protein [Cyanobacterium sp. IPPAS B-1200]|uniref:PEP-CTERM sorting domain-containing protein n=1 Tax=Cyanobacterium sp. IPPAS B-1200 TaxID=1562720 RepID=UPI0008525617|nr:PEP-CTERM sorting domain-containing protein [Cyanobacterium sp. IPPAS B-1200]OEJ77309.1 hypothetical protein A5482_06300 [Cyanobacterium sp. IPPAS B-1200]
MKKQIVLISALTASLLTFLPSQKSSASVLTFNIDNLANEQSIPQGYGDNIDSIKDGFFNYEQGNNFTDKITVQYRTLSLSNFGTSNYSGTNGLSYYESASGDDYSGLNKVAYAAGGDVIGEISFIPETGVSVLLNSFDLSTYLNEPGDNQRLAVFDENYNILWTSNGVTNSSDAFVNITENAKLTLLPNITHNGILRIQFGNSGNIGISNINFDQVLEIPEPSSVMGILFLGGLGLASMKKKFGDN